MALEELMQQHPRLPRFTGSNPALWISQATRYFLFYAIYDDERFPYVIESFDDEPFWWFNGWHRSLYSVTWNDFTVAMLNRFNVGTLDEHPTNSATAASVLPKVCNSTLDANLSIVNDSISMAESSVQLNQGGHASYLGFPQANCLTVSPSILYSPSLLITSIDRSDAIHKGYDILIPQGFFQVYIGPKFFITVYSTHQVHLGNSAIIIIGPLPPFGANVHITDFGFDPGPNFINTPSPNCIIMRLNHHEPPEPHTPCTTATAIPEALHFSSDFHRNPAPTSAFQTYYNHERAMWATKQVADLDILVKQITSSSSRVAECNPYFIAVDQGLIIDGVGLRKSISRVYKGENVTPTVSSRVFNLGVFAKLGSSRKNGFLSRDIGALDNKVPKDFMACLEFTKRGCTMLLDIEMIYTSIPLSANWIQLTYSFPTTVMLAIYKTHLASISISWVPTKFIMFFRRRVTQALFLWKVTCHYSLFWFGNFTLHNWFNAYILCWCTTCGKVLGYNRFCALINDCEVICARSIYHVGSLTTLVAYPASTNAKSGPNVRLSQTFVIVADVFVDFASWIGIFSLMQARKALLVLPNSLVDHGYTFLALVVLNFAIRTTHLCITVNVLDQPNLYMTLTSGSNQLHFNKDVGMVATVWNFWSTYSVAFFLFQAYTMVVVESVEAVTVNENTDVSGTKARAPGTRTSARIQKIKSAQDEVRRREQEEMVTKPLKKQRVNYNKKKVVTESVLAEVVNEVVREAEKKVIGENVEEMKAEEKDLVVCSLTERLVGEKSAYSMVTDTIRAFYKHFLYYVQEEEKRCKKHEDDKEKPESKEEEKKSNKNKNTKKKPKSQEDAIEEKGKAKRPDLKALSNMLTSNTVLTPPTRIGSIPGVDVGHQFFSRCEMVTVGFHNHWLSGIDYIGASSQREYPNYKLPLTVAIVMSGQYEDDLDNSEDVVYTGQGGNNLLGDKRQIKDQVMARGNLGLKHCLEQNVPVRVIRGHQSTTSYVGKVYTYDGLYKVDKYWAEKGVSGFTVYKFRLKRMEGQPSLLTEQVYFSRGRIPENVSELRGLVCEDISGGLENIPIPATNLVDDPPVAPTGCTYIKSLQVSKNVVLPSSAPGCDCKGSCTDPRSCACARLNGSDFPYVHRDGGRLIEPKAVVFECGPNCGCGPDCVNRTSQRGLRYRLEVFKTPKKGWAVRSWDFIPSGAPVCEYIGILKKTDDVDSNPENNYIFDIDCIETMKGLGGRERRVGEVAMPSLQVKSDDKDSGPEFCIDAGTTGNVARYINHSCQPNLFVQCVLSAHHDFTQARVVLFAADNILPLKELTYDYGYELDSVHGPDGKIKQLACYCGAPDCRKRLF